MVEQFVNELTVRLSNYFSFGDLSIIRREVCLAVKDYEISKKSTELSIWHGQLPDCYRAFMVTKHLEGLSENTLSLYKNYLEDMFFTIHKPVETISTNDLRVYLYLVQKNRGVSNRTLDSRRSVLSIFFSWSASEGYIPTDPSFNIKPIKYTRKPRKALSQRELEIVRRTCTNDRDRAIVETLYSTGCRVTELCNIRLGDIDWAKHELIVLGKGSKYRTVYLNAKAEVAIEVYLKNRKHNSEYLFCNIRGGGQMKPCNVERIFAVIAEKTHIIVTPHIMRHTFATQALTGTGVEVVQKMLGHSSIATTMVYAEVDQSLIHIAHTRSVV